MTVLAHQRKGARHGLAWHSRGAGEFGKCLKVNVFLRSSAEERAPEKGEFKAERLAEGDMPVAFHEPDHKAIPENRQDTDERL